MEVKQCIRLLVNVSDVHDCLDANPFGVQVYSLAKKHKCMMWYYQLPS